MTMATYPIQAEGLTKRYRSTTALLVSEQVALDLGGDVVVRLGPQEEPGPRLGGRSGQGQVITER
jgi:hypothetical protein